jgi:catechol 2,3-dioxygenase-like lactoylglutathione lyase family enzyme
MNSSTAQVYDRSTEDVGNIVEFGHVNIRVPDQQQAIVFYVMGLGLTRDPFLVTGVDNAWINVGTCQFHLPVGPAQVLAGVIGLVLPDLDALVQRLIAVAPRLKGTRFAFVRDGAQVRIHCPWGNRVHVHAPDPARFGAMVLGMPYVQLDVPRGAAAGIARFYTDVLAARVLTATQEGVACARVPIGLGESLEFRETDQPLPAYDGHHVQIGVADFSGVHRRLQQRGLVTEESNQSQYRFQDIVDPDSGAVLATLEHEVRSMRHPMYARVLVNRDPAIGNSTYAPGHESARWRMAPR